MDSNPDETEKLRNGLMFAIKCIKSLNEIKTNIKRILDSKVLSTIVLTEEDVKKLNKLNDNCDKVFNQNKSYNELNFNSIEDLFNGLKTNKTIETNEEPNDSIETTDETTEESYISQKTSETQNDNKSKEITENDCNLIEDNPIITSVEKTKKSVKCFSCGKEFVDYKLLNEHLKSHQKPKLWRIVSSDRSQNTGDENQALNRRKDKFPPIRPKITNPLNKPVVIKSGVPVLTSLWMKCPFESCYLYFTSESILSTHCKNVHKIDFQTIKLNYQKNIETDLKINEQNDEKQETISGQTNEIFDHNLVNSSTNEKSVSDIDLQNNGSDFNDRHKDMSVLYIDKLVEKHNSIISNWIKCPIEGCYTVVNTEIETQNHLLIKHFHSKYLTFCPYFGCGLLLTTNEDTRRHITRKHGNHFLALTSGLAAEDKTSHGSREQDSNPSNKSLNSLKRVKLKQSRVRKNHHYVIDLVEDGEKTKTIIRCIVNKCHQLFASYEELRKHLFVHYKCPNNDCSFEGQCNSQLEFHLKKEHPDYQPLTCLMESCKRSFATQESLDIHQKRCHEDMSKTFKCSFIGCFKTFRTNQALTNHKPVHNIGRPFKCDVVGCEYSAKLRSYIRRHKNKVHTLAKPFVCDEESCGAVFKRALLLKTHKERVHSPKVVECPIENCRSKVRDYRLVFHMKSCHSQERISCDYPNCKFTTNTVRKLRDHQLIHTNKQKFVCDWKDCGKRFKKRHLLNDHILSHKNDKGFVCDWPECKFKGNTNQALRQHIRNNHLLNVSHNVCHWPGCEKQYKTKMQLKFHMNSHTNEKPMVCDFPGCNYRTGCSYFYEHRKKHYK